MADTKIHSIETKTARPLAMELEMDAGIKIADRMDASTIEKTRSIPIPSLATAPNTTLDGRVTKGNPDLKEIKDGLIELAVTEKGPVANYIFRLREVIQKVLSRLIEVSENEQKGKQEKIAKFKEANKDWGNVTVQMGNRGLIFTLISFGLQASQFLFPIPDRKFISFLADEGSKNLRGMYDSANEAERKQLDSLATTIQQDISEILNKGSGDSAVKNDLTNLLREAFASLPQSISRT